MFTLLTKVSQHTASSTTTSANPKSSPTSSGTRSPTSSASATPTPPRSPSSSSSSSSSSKPVITETPTQRRERINFQRLMRTCEEILMTGKYREVELNDSSDTKESKSSSPAPSTTTSGMTPAQAHIFTSYLHTLSSQLTALSTHTHMSPHHAQRRIAFLTNLATRHGCTLDISHDDMIWTQAERDATRDVVRRVEGKQREMWRSQLLERETKYDENIPEISDTSITSLSDRITSPSSSPSPTSVTTTDDMDIPTTTPPVVNLTSHDDTKQRIATWTAEDRIMNTHIPTSTTTRRTRVARSHLEEKTLAADAQQHEAMLGDVSTLTSQLKDTAHRIHQHLQHDKVILETVADQVEHNLDAVGKQKNRLEEIVNRSCGQTCSIYLLLIMVICVWMGTYLMIRIMPNPPKT